MDVDLDGLSLDGQLCFALYSTLHAVGRAYAPLLSKLDLTYPQYLAMLVLWQQDDVTVKEIGARLYLDSGTLTPLLKRLEAAGLVRRDRNPQDERQVLIRLTEQGRALRAQARAVPVHMGCSMRLSPERFEALRADLFALRANLMASLDPDVGVVASAEPA